MNATWADDVLHFWLGEIGEEAWFRRDAQLDALIRAQFGELHRELLGVPDHAFRTARESLAAVIVFDQFSRNMFRDDPRAYATDSRALAVALRAMDLGLDLQLTPSERLFLYMPLQHSENAAVQARSVEVFVALGFGDTLKYARAHRDVIDRFGRFPHRNFVLGRASTPEEIEFMRTHPGF